MPPSPPLLPAPGQHSLSVLLLPLVQEPAVLGVQVGRVRSEHLRLRPGESGRSRRGPQRAGQGGWDRDDPYLRLCRWDPGPGGGCEGGGAGGAPKKARNPLAGDIICPTLPCSSLGLTEGRGLPTRPETRANWLGDIRPAWQGRERARSQPGEDLGAKGKAQPGRRRLGRSGTAPQSQLPQPRQEKRGPRGQGSAGRERRRLYLGSSQQLRSLQVGEDRGDAVGERVAQEGRILEKQKGRGTPVSQEQATAQDEAPGKAPRGVGGLGRISQRRGPRYLRPRGGGAEGAGYRYVAELVGGHPLAVGSRVALLHGSSDVDRLRTEDLGGGTQHGPPLARRGPACAP